MYFPKPLELHNIICYIAAFFYYRKWLWKYPYAKKKLVSVKFKKFIGKPVLSFLEIIEAHGSLVGNSDRKLSISPFGKVCDVSSGEREDVQNQRQVFN